MKKLYVQTFKMPDELTKDKPMDRRATTGAKSIEYNRCNKSIPD